MASSPPSGSKAQPDGGAPAQAVPAAGIPAHVRAIRYGYRALPALVLGLVLGVFGTLVWQVFFADAGNDAFAPAPQPRNPDVVITLSYELIAALIGEEVKTSNVDLPLSDIRAGANDGRLQLRGTLRVLRQDVAATVDLEPVIENGRLVTRVTRARLGVLPVPSNLQRLAEDPLNRELAKVIANLPATLTSVRVADAGLVVTADVRIEELPFFQAR